MDSSEALTLWTPAFDSETLAAFAEAVKRIGAVLLEIRDRFVQAIKPVVEAIAKSLRDFLKNAMRSVATKKEWHIFTHTKKRRIREKYRKRLTQRLLAILAEAME